MLYILRYLQVSADRSSELIPFLSPEAVRNLIGDDPNSSTARKVESSNFANRIDRQRRIVFRVSHQNFEPY